MGQKVSPIGLRIGINKDWEAKWYANNSEFADYLEKDILIRKYVEKNLDNAGISKVEIERNNKRCELIIHTSKPGVIIGKGGEGITNIKEDIKKLVNEDVQVSIVDVKRADLDAALVAQNIASQIEGRVSFRVAQKRAIQNAMKAGAKGIKTLASGRLGGADIARGEGYSEGTIPLHTLRADIDYATAEADTTFGKIGIKVWIYKGEILDGESKEKEERPNRNRRNNNQRRERKEENNNKAKGGN